jgi:hypothetical protein
MAHAMEPISKYGAACLPYSTRVSIRLHQALGQSDIPGFRAQKPSRIDWGSTLATEDTPAVPEKLFCAHDLLDISIIDRLVIVCCDPGMIWE